MNNEGSLNRWITHCPELAAELDLIAERAGRLAQSARAYVDEAPASTDPGHVLDHLRAIAGMLHCGITYLRTNVDDHG